MKINIFKAVKYCCVLHGRVCVMSPTRSETSETGFLATSLNYIGSIRSKKKKDRQKSKRDFYKSLGFERVQVEVMFVHGQ